LGLCQRPARQRTGNAVNFDLTTAAEIARYPLPDNGHAGGVCNDMAVDANGTLFVSETNGSGAGRILALVANNAGEKRLITVIGANSLGGVDGLAFLGDTLYVNDVLANKLYRLELNGTSLVSFTVLNVSMDMGRPDGMRTTLDGTALLMAEGGANRVDLVTIDGDNATITVLRDGMTQPTGIAQIGNTAYVVESRSAAVVNQNQLPFIANPAPDASPFYAIAVPLP
jgi:sugar lactone lactonase YvrE